jgi:bla regulator protein BlaR1
VSEERCGQWSRNPFVVVTVSICFGVLGIYAATGQTQAALGDRPTFAVASVKPHKSDDRRSSRSTFTPNGVEFIDRAAGFIVGEAYHFPLGRVLGPDSLTSPKLLGLLSESYDIVAKTDGEVSQDELRMMLQSLLAERFKLSLHLQSKEAPVYKLTVTKDGPRLAEAEGEGVFEILHGGDAVTFRYADMMRLSNFLSGRVDRTVIDQTGLKGLYNFTLRSPEERFDQGVKSDQAGPDSMGPNLFADPLKALGLQLVKDKAPVEYLVIDHIERATGN